MELETKEQKECVVSGAMATALRVARVVGFAPVRFQSTSSGVHTVTTSRTAAIISGIGITMLRLSIFAILLFDLTLPEIAKGLALESMSSVLLFTTDVVLTVSVTSLAVFNGQRRMRRFFRILALTQKINDKTAYDSAKDHKPWKVWVSILTAICGGYSLMLFNMVVFIIRNGGNKRMALIFMYAFYFEGGLVIFLIIQDSILFLAIHSTTKAFNDYIRQLFHKSFPSNQEVKQLFLSLLSICNIVDLVTDSEGIIFLLVILRLNLYIFVSVYYLTLFSLFSNKSLESVLQIICQALWFVWHSVKILVMIEPCHRLYEEMQTTKYLVNRLQCERQSHQNPTCRDTKINDNITFLIEIPMFSPLGIIKFGRPLLATIAGAVATFFLILVQFNFKRT